MSEKLRRQPSKLRLLWPTKTEKLETAGKNLRRRLRRSNMVAIFFAFKSHFSAVEEDSKEDDVVGRIEDDEEG